MVKKNKEANAELEKLQKGCIDQVEEFENMFKRARNVHDQRTKDFKLYAQIAHMENLYDDDDIIFSEGSTQSLERKMRAQSLQRVPDGELITQYDKNSIEQIEMEYIFEHKILRSEYSGKSMYKNLWKSFDNAYVYGFACVRTGFEKDSRGDVRISYNHIPYNHVFPNPDCDDIAEAEWYIVEEMLSKAYLEGLFDKNDKLTDSTWNEDAIRYILKEESFDPSDQTRPDNLEDNKRGVFKLESIKVRTLYRRGDSEFIMYAPKLKLILRKTKNYDPRLETPLHFMILEPNPEFPLGCSSVRWTLSHQQYADAFMSSSYNALLLATDPPLQGTGDFTDTDIYMLPGAFWDLGTNPNAKIEPFRVETTTITQYGSILEQVAGSMARIMNAPDTTIASDANVPSYSKTPNGVEQQKEDKTITVNQYQKMIEEFFSEWANHALRSYLAAMGGKQELTVDESTRRKIADIEETLQRKEERKNPKNPKTLPSIIDLKTNKIKINFDRLTADRLDFQVRTGSLIQDPQSKQREAIQDALVSTSQMLGNVSDERKPVIETIVISMIKRLLELSDIDIASSSAELLEAEKQTAILKAFGNQIMLQNQAINKLEQITTQLAQSQIQTNNQQMQQQQQIDQQGQVAAQQPAPQQSQSQPQPQSQPAMTPEQMQAMMAAAQQQVPQAEEVPAELGSPESEAEMPQETVE